MNTFPRLSLRPIVVSGLLALGFWAPLLPAQDFRAVVSNELQLTTRAETPAEWSNHTSLDAFFESSGDWWRVQALGGLSYAVQTGQSPHLSGDLYILYGQFFLVEAFGLPDSSGTLTVGRAPARDPSALVLRTPLDQLEVRFRSPPFGFSLGLGSTGLIGKDTIALAYTIRDILDSLNSSQFFATPRLFAWTFVEFEAHPHLNLDLGYLRQQDLRGLVAPNDTLAQPGDLLYQPNGSPPFHTNYVVANLLWGLPSLGSLLQVAGALSQGSSLTYIIGDAYRDLPHLGWAATVQFQSKLLDEGAVVALRALTASGDPAQRLDFYEGGLLADSLGVLSTFRTATAASIGRVFAPKIGNLAQVDLSWTHRPFQGHPRRVLRGLEYRLAVTTSFRLGRGAISVPVNPISEQNYLGTEVSLNADWALLSDLSLSLWSAWFLPNSGAGGVFEGVRNSFENLNSLVIRVTF